MPRIVHDLLCLALFVLGALAAFAIIWGELHVA